MQNAEVHLCVNNHGDISIIGHSRVTLVERHLTLKMKKLILPIQTKLSTDAKNRKLIFAVANASGFHLVQCLHFCMAKHARKEG